MNFMLLGNQRSSTSFFLDILRHHDNVDTINEPFSMHLDFFRENLDFWDEKDYDDKYLHSQLAKMENTIEYIKELDLWLNHDFPSVRGIKETALFEKYRWIKHTLKIEKCIILIRNPIAITYSVYRRNMQNSWWNYKEKLNYITI